MTSAVQQYPQNIYMLVAETSPLELGSYVLAESGDIQNAEIRIYNQKTGAYSYALTLIISSSEGGPALATSTAVTFDNTETGQATSYWLGAVCFTFTDYTLLAGQRYYFRLSYTGYTRSGDTTYMGVLCDWIEPIGLINTGGARIAIEVLQ